MPESQVDVGRAQINVPLYNLERSELDALQMRLTMGLDGRHWVIANDGSSITIELYDTDVVGVVRKHIGTIVDNALPSSNFALIPCIR